MLMWLTVSMLHWSYISPANATAAEFVNITVTVIQFLPLKVLLSIVLLLTTLNSM